MNRLYGVDIAGSTPFAAGYYATSGGIHMPLIMKWNGTKFANQGVSVPGGGYTNADLYAISFNSSTNGWAVGQTYYISGGTRYQKDVMYQYNGSSWTATVGSMTNGNLRSVASISNNEAWAVGWISRDTNPYILHYTTANGWQRDTSFTFPSTTYVQSVSADSANNVWIVGYFNNGSGIIPFTLHNNGSGWQQVTIPNSSGYLLGVTVTQGKAYTGGDVWNGSAYEALTFQSK